MFLVFLIKYKNVLTLFVRRMTSECLAHILEHTGNSQARGWGWNSVGKEFAQRAGSLGLMPSSVVHSCNSNTGEGAAGRWKAQSHLWLCDDYDASLGYMRPCVGEGDKKGRKQTRWEFRNRKNGNKTSCGPKRQATSWRLDSLFAARIASLHKTPWVLLRSEPSFSPGSRSPRLLIFWVRWEFSLQQP